MITCTSKDMYCDRAISRYRCSVTSTEIASITSNAIVQSGVGIKKSLKKLQRPV